MRVLFCDGGVKFFLMVLILLLLMIIVIWCFKVFDVLVKILFVWIIVFVFMLNESVLIVVYSKVNGMFFMSIFFNDWMYIV